MLLLHLCLPTLVQFLHSIPAVHKTHDEATIDALKEASLTVLEFAEFWKKNGWQLKLRVQNTSFNLREPTPNQKCKFKTNLISNFSF